MNTPNHRIHSLLALMALLFVSSAAHAQVDTVREFDPHFLHQYADDSLVPFLYTNYCDRNTFIIPPVEWDLCLQYDIEMVSEYAAQFDYPGPHRIYGLAAMMQFDCLKSLIYHGHLDSVALHGWTAWLKLYNPKNLLTPLASGVIRYADCDRYMEYTGCWNTACMGSDYDDAANTLKTVILLQCEFDSAITVYDSFIVSLADEHVDAPSYQYDSALFFRMASALYKYGCLSSMVNEDCLAEQYPPQKFWVADDNRNWYGYSSPCVMQIFPIIDLPEDTCPAVSNVHITDAYGSLVMMEWEAAANNNRWEVSYGLVGTEPDDGTIVTSYTPSAKLLNLNVDSQYVVYVRPVCRFGITKRGAWSDGVVFNPLTGEVGIPQVADAEPLALYPNPASGTVRIGLPDGQQGVDVRLYDMAGREVLRCASLTLDVNRLPQGTYTVRVATTTGTYSGRLVVAE